MTEIAIIGSGLAGLSLTQSLLDRGVDAESITVIDADDDERASDVPGILMHPFPGRSMKPKPGHMAIAQKSVAYLRRLADEMADGAILELPMARPLIGEMGERLQASWEEARAEYPEWFESRLVAGDELAEVDPNLAAFDEAIVYRPAFSVDTNALRRHLRAKFTQAGVHLVDRTPVERLERAGDRWRLVTDAEPIEADKVILALGFGIAEWFPGLPIHGRGGEVMIVRPPDDGELRCIINASGHVAPKGDGTWSAGSTYWSPEEFDGRTDELAKTQLLERCTRLVPALEGGEPVSYGRGIRAMYRGDNRPLVGDVPGLPDAFVFGAFGSKGLLRIPALADQLAAHLCDAGEIGERASTARVKTDKWTPAAGKLG
ncbi:FAD-binding oxidoreductase [Persicimonas caeni]|uniref:FAD-binding oxidoreductase n=1 Tax=Persicimonas caeni TaxID=2292766 RepID=A0A4Y6PPN2_PERCE|nr:FAD-dependent oxidoreductase [Persicimonas caeni]QDG50230.1 FAD-binding oxidoreductase [Persicimonas caeni]QED31451.1 FAD-binding oxidoreductase [Persicimonas caeni]